MARIKYCSLYWQSWCLKAYLFKDMFSERNFKLTVKTKSRYKSNLISTHTFALTKQVKEPLTVASTVGEKKKAVDAKFSKHPHYVYR